MELFVFLTKPSIFLFEEVDESVRLVLSVSVVLFVCAFDAWTVRVESALVGYFGEKEGLVFLLATEVVLEIPDFV